MRKNDAEKNPCSHFLKTLEEIFQSHPEKRLFHFFSSGLTLFTLKRKKENQHTDSPEEISGGRKRNVKTLRFPLIDKIRSSFYGELGGTPTPDGENPLRNLSAFRRDKSQSSHAI